MEQDKRLKEYVLMDSNATIDAKLWLVNVTG